VVDGEQLAFARGRDRRAIVGIADMPITFGGAAGTTWPTRWARSGSDRAGLRRRRDPARADGVRERSGAESWTRERVAARRVTAIVDYAHNPHGMAAL